LQFFRRVLRRLALGAAEGTDADGSAGVRTHTSEASQTQSKATSSSARQPSNSRSLKRQLPQNDGNSEDDGDAEEGSGRPPSKKKRCQDGDDAEIPIFLACPFWKRDQRKYWSCPGIKIKIISHMKQHLYRQHAPEYYCTRCLTTFATDDLHQIHNEAGSCQFTPGKTLDGITLAQRAQLKRKHRELNTEEDRWYKMWEILFPGVPRPASVYYRPDQLIEADQLRDTVVRDAGRYMEEELRASGYTPREGLSYDQVADIGRRAMLRLLDSFYGRAEVASGPSQRGTESAGSDSGVGVGPVQPAAGHGIEAPSLNFEGHLWPGGGDGVGNLGLGETMAAYQVDGNGVFNVEVDGQTGNLEDYTFISDPILGGNFDSLLQEILEPGVDP
jgi:hypothetical protein